MRKRYDLLADVAPMLVSALSWRNDVGVYASAIARELGLTIEDDEATVLARLREALTVPDLRAENAALRELLSAASAAADVPLPADDGDMQVHYLTCARRADLIAIYARPNESVGTLRDRAEHLAGEAARPLRYAPKGPRLADAQTALPGHHKPLADDAPTLNEDAAPVYLLACKCQMLGTRAIGAQVTCGLHGDTTVVLAIPLGAPAEPDRAHQPGAPAEAAPSKLTITDDQMTSDATRHKAELVKLPSPLTGYSWQVTWLPGQHLTREQAITAMTIAEVIGAHDVLGDPLHSGHRLWPHLDAWAAELGITGPRALALASMSPEDIQDGTVPGGE